MFGCGSKHNADADAIKPLNAWVAVRKGGWAWGKCDDLFYPGVPGGCWYRWLEYRSLGLWQSVQQGLRHVGVLVMVLQG